MTLGCLLCYFRRGLAEIDGATRFTWVSGSGSGSKAVTCGT